jgi:hypothetical protein
VTERFGGCLNYGKKMEPLWVALGQLWTQLRVKATQPSGSINVIRANPLTIALIEGWATTLSKFADTGGSVVAEAFVARPRRQAHGICSSPASD